METIHAGVLITHTVIALVIIILVLLQRGKGADAGAAFGSGASGTVFGSRGTGSFFSRATGILATLFFVTSLSLAYIATQGPGSPTTLLDDAPAVEAELPEATPGDAEDVPDLPGSEESADPAVDEGLPSLPADEEESTE